MLNTDESKPEPFEMRAFLLINNVESILFDGFDGLKHKVFHHFSAAKENAKKNKSFAHWTTAK